LLVLTATPGSDSHRQLQLLAVVGTQRLEPDEETPTSSVTAATAVTSALSWP
jgi:hypothetical protein